MLKRRKFLLIAPLLALVGLTALSPKPPAEAAFYRYTDQEGGVHFTDRLESIPPEYRNQIKEYKKIRPPEAPPPQEQGDRKAPAEVNREGQRRDAEGGKKEAEAKAAQEKAAQEAKQKAREEKLKEIADLQEKVAAKQKEAGSLRTNWMVYDRLKLNQLNEEIASLGKQIAAIQKEISE